MHTDENSVLCVNMHTMDVTVQYTGLSLDCQVSIGHTYVHVPISLGKQPQQQFIIIATIVLVWFPDPSTKPRTDPRGRVWANDLLYGRS